MNVFVLCTGRCGATTFHRACEHIENYSAGHDLSTPERNASVCVDYCRTSSANIRAFLESKSRAFDFRLEEARRRFPVFWRDIGAEGDRDAAMAEFEVRHNRSKRRFSHSIRGFAHRLRTRFR